MLPPVGPPNQVVHRWGRFLKHMAPSEILYDLMAISSMELSRVLLTEVLSNYLLRAVTLKLPRWFLPSYDSRHPATQVACIPGQRGF